MNSLKSDLSGMWFAEQFSLWYTELTFKYIVLSRLYL